MIDIQDMNVVQLNDLAGAIRELLRFAMGHAKLVELYQSGKSLWNCEGRLYFYDNGRLIPQGAAKEYKR